MCSSDLMLWEMLVGQRLFVAEDTRATLARVLFGTIPRPRALRPEVPKDLERVTMKLLERDLPARYATGEEAITDLMNCADAPRGGREALVALLVERFPDSARLRQSVARARSLGVVPSPVPAASSPVRATLPDSTGGPVAPTIASRPAPASPGLGTQRSAPTSTLRRPGRRWPGQLLILVTVMLSSGIVGFMVVAAAKGKPAPGVHKAARADADAAAGHTGPHAGVPDAGSAGPRDGATSP